MLSPLSSLTIVRQALFSGEDDPIHRYELQRLWDATLPTMIWIMLNPSTADHLIDDPTIQACIEFARRNGCGSITVVNLFAFRSPHPKVMQAAEDPIGTENDNYILEAIDLIKNTAGGYLIAAWGTGGDFMGRAAEVEKLCLEQGQTLYCFGRTKDGHPKHPLARGHHRIPRTTAPFPWREQA